MEKEISAELRPELCRYPEEWRRRKEVREEGGREREAVVNSVVIDLSSKNSKKKTREGGRSMRMRDGRRVVSKHLTSTTTYSPGSLILSTLLVNISRVEALGERRAG